MLKKNATTSKQTREARKLIPLLAWNITSKILYRIKDKVGILTIGNLAKEKKITNYNFKIIRKKKHTNILNETYFKINWMCRYNCICICEDVFPIKNFQLYYTSILDNQKLKRCFPSDNTIFTFILKKISFHTSKNHWNPSCM